MSVPPLYMIQLQVLVETWENIAPGIYVKSWAYNMYKQMTYTDTCNICTSCTYRHYWSVHIIQNEIHVFRLGLVCLTVFQLI